MAKTIKFKQASGLTAFALSCGYVQAARLQTGDAETVVKLSHSGSCYHVNVHDHGGAGLVHFTATDSIGHARKVWAEWVNIAHGAVIATAKSDKRYRVAREFCGESELCYVARFCGEWLGKSDTAQGAWLLAYNDLRQRAALLVPTSSAFVSSGWHAWQGAANYMLSDELSKVLREFDSVDDCINWLFTNGHKDVARALNTHAKGVKP